MTLPKNSDSDSSFPKPHSSSPKNSHLPQYLACGVLCLGGFLGGNTCGWSSVALPSLQLSGDFLSINTTDLSWIASITMLGTLVGSFSGGYFIRKLGRKSSLILSAFPFTIGWACLTFPFHIWMLYTGRFLVGVGLGLKAIAGSVYLSEIAEPEIRGRLSVLWFVAIRLGVLFEYGIGSLLSYDHLSGISVVLSVVYGVGICFLPESPRWLMTKWRRDNAIASLCWLRDCEKTSPSPKILEEINEIQEAVVRTEIESKLSSSSSSSITSTYFTNVLVLKSVLIATILMLSKEACGGNVFSYYTVQVFEKIGSALDSHVSGVVVGVAQLVAILFTTYYVDKVGRRTLLITSFIIMSLALILLGLLYHFKTEIASVTQYSDWISLVTFVTYHVAYSGGPFVLAWAVTSEVIPTKVIGSVSGLTISFGWIFAFVLTRFYEDMNQGIGIANTFMLFAGMTVASTVCIHLLVPETVGKSLENIHQTQNLDSDKKNEKEDDGV